MIILAFNRCCGLVVRILGSRNPLSRVPSLGPYSSTETSPSTSNSCFIFRSWAHNKFESLADLRVWAYSQVHLDDYNVLSVVDYAVGQLDVKHGRSRVPLRSEWEVIRTLFPVAVVGHTHCGGAAACVKAASSPHQPANSPLARWLEPLTELARSLKDDSLQEKEAISLLVKESVKKQVKNLVETETIKKAWGKGDDVRVHGLVYDLSTGRLSDLGVTESLK